MSQFWYDWNLSMVRDQTLSLLARSRTIASFNFGDWMIRDHLKFAEFVVLAVENLVGLYLRLIPKY